MVKEFKSQQRYWRQLDIIAPSEIDKKIGIIGAGGIGSPTALVLTKLGFPYITIWDNDKVEEHNLPNQLFKESNIGEYKTTALNKTLKEYDLDIDLLTITKKFNSEVKKPTHRFNCIRDIMICTVDSMDERKKIWEIIKDSKCRLFIDARMGGELMRIYSVDPQNILDQEFYDGHFYSSKDADKLPCTARSIFYNCFVIAGLIGNQCKKFIKEEEYPKEIIFDLKNLEFLTTK